MSTEIVTRTKTKWIDRGSSGEDLYLAICHAADVSQGPVLHVETNVIGQNVFTKIGSGKNIFIRKELPKEGTSDADDLLEACEIVAENNGLELVDLSTQPA